MLLNEEPNRHDSESSLPSTEPPDPSSEDEPDDGTGESFDTQLPTQHSVIISFVVLWNFYSFLDFSIWAKDKKSLEEQS